jgi:2-keto-4-pentenoate hydratase/2-oxohepta-3-ene-1,7-dioic acid hydratase in catechol pathway
MPRELLPPHTDMIFDLPALVAYASTRCTLDPEDVIMTGTPSGVGAGRRVFQKPGDVIEAYAEGIGALVNPVEAGAAE